MTVEVWDYFLLFQVSVDVAWSPFNIDLRYYDYGGLAEAADFLFVMAYDEQSQILGDCIAGANSGFPRAMQGMIYLLSVCRIYLLLLNIF